MRRLAFIWLCVLPMIGCQEEAGGGAFEIDTLPGRVIQTVSTQPTWSHTANGWHLQEVSRFGADDGSPGELAGPRQIAIEDALADGAKSICIIGDCRSLIRKRSPDACLAYEANA